MNTQNRNTIIRETKKTHPDWPYRKIGESFGISGQRVHQIVKDAESNGIIDNIMEPRINYRLNGEPISATQLARETGIPQWTIEKWVQRGLVKILEHPGHTAPGKPVLLDPVTLQERIDRYQPRPRRNRVSA